jgi:hypothetical protein
MRRFATLFSIILTIASSSALAQPAVSYTIPDIGAPGMNVYVEIIGPWGSKWNFSNQDIEFEGPGTPLYVEPVNAADNARIVVGPCVVSWEGRMISTQIFVKKGAAPGPCPIHVVRNGTPGAPIGFTIVTPAPLNLTGGGAIGSGGAFGTRSQRGAMIVSSLNVGAGNYTVSTADCDPTIVGNQGYLPFIIISTGPVTINSGARIALDALNRDAAAGGGGGGGQVCDAITFGGGTGAGVGTNGGNGYTGGSWGGRNDQGVFVGPKGDIIQANGTGTGATVTHFGGKASGSLNGAPGGKDISAPSAQNIQCYPEGAAGGTGHPFGEGGTASCGGTQSGTAGHGGAGGAMNNASGSGAGYGGNGANGGGQGGLRHGNKHGVPLAGGSGGGSGNPEGSGVCAGEGGGGGGAIAIFSQERLTNAGSITVHGAPGGSGGAEGGGGGGSGGMAIIGAKDTLAIGGALSAAAGAGGPGTPGGGNGSQGRLRYDGFPVNTREPVLNNAASTYVGITTDTVTYVAKPTYRLWGTSDSQSDIYVWIKGDNAYTSWTRIYGPGASTRVQFRGRRWYADLTFPAGGNYYIVAAQEEATENTDQWERTPQMVMSQAAANIIYVDLTPKINHDTTLFVRDVACERSVTDSFKIVNSGYATLTVNAPTIAPSTDFQVVSPTFPISIPGISANNDTSFIWVTYVFAPTTPGTKTATFTFVNNDPRIDVNDPVVGQNNPRNPLVVQVTGRKLRFEPRLSTYDLRLPEVCVDSTSSATMQFFWNTDSTGSIVRIDPIGTGPFSILAPTVFPTSPRTLPGGNLPITVQFHPTAPGSFTQQFRVIVSPCDTPLVLTGRGTAVQANMAVNPDPIDFGLVPVGTTASQAVSVTNNGTSTEVIASIYFVPALPELTAPNLLGQTLRPTMSIPGTATYTPTTAGQIPAGTRMCIVFTGTCPDTVCIPVTGTAITSMLVLDSMITLRAEPCAQQAPLETDTLHLRNLGTAGVDIVSIASALGRVTLLTNPTVPSTLGSGQEITIVVRYQPGPTGTFYDTVVVRTSSSDPQQRELRTIVRLIRDRSKIDVLDSAGNVVDPLPVDFGSLLDCDAERVVRFIVRSGGNITENVGVRMADGSAFTVTPSPAFTLDAGGDQSLTVRFSTGSSGVFTDTLIVTNELCNEEIRIPVIGRRSGLRYTYPGYDFGQSNVGITVTGSTFFRFDSTTTNDVRTVVRDVFVKQTGTAFAITRKSMPATLAPNEITTVDISFTPAAQQTYSAELCWIRETPCLDTLCVPITGEGILANLLVRRSTLDFGPHFVCQDSTLDLVIENAGNAPVDISAITLGGADAAAFQQVTPVGVPLTLTPGDSLTITYRFDPSLVATDGVKTATVTIVSNDPNRPSLVVTLIGERRRQAIQSPASIDFGSVDVGTFAEQDLVLYNRSDAPLRIDALPISAPFTIVSPTTLPITIPPAPGSVTIRVRFTPVDSLPASSDLVAHYTEPCVDSTVVPVRGQGKILAVGLADITLADVTGAPGDEVVIPLVLTRGERLREAEATTIHATVRFNKSLLYPHRIRAANEALPKPVTGEAVSLGNIISSAIVGDDRVLTFEVTNDPMPVAPDTVAFIDATVLLGDRITTPMSIDTLYFTDGRVVTSTQDAIFTLVGYCEVGVNRLVRMTGAAGIKAVSPNPFNPTTEILFETSEAGASTLTVFDANGRIVTRLVDGIRLPVGAHVVTWDASTQPSGVYYIELRTPTERSIERAVLVK